MVIITHSQNKADPFPLGMRQRANNIGWSRPALGRSCGAAHPIRSSRRQSRKPAPRSSAFHARAGFTLLELFVVMGIIGLLMAMLLPSLSRIRESARRTQDLSNLRQLSLACTSYAADNDGVLPAGRAAGTAPNADDYTWTNYSRCWKLLVQRMPTLAQNNSCSSVREGYADANEFGVV